MLSSICESNILRQSLNINPLEMIKFVLQADKDINMETHKLDVLDGCSCVLLLPVATLECCAKRQYERKEQAG